ncbi:MAG TPA: response regulator [Pyrinomonadaceae bacterium]
MSPNKPRVLIAEDHQDTIELLTLVLTRENYSTAFSQSVCEAVELAKTEKFDVILIDSYLNDGTGVELCRTIRQYDDVTPIIFYSGLAYEKDKEAAYAAGAQDYLVKPVPTSLLVQSVRKLAAGAKRIGPPGHRTVETRKDSGELLMGF